MGEKTNEVSSVSGVLLKVGGVVIIQELHAVLTAVWQSGTIPSNWKRGLLSPIVFSGEHCVAPATQRNLEG